jgi:hypothetical protein
MNCGEFNEIVISTEEKQVDEGNKQFFINVCYYSNSEDVNPFTCVTNSKKFAFIPYNDNLLKLFPKGYTELDLIGKIYSFEIEFIKLVNLQDNWYNKLTSKTTNKSSKLICYFMFSDGDSDTDREKFECFKNLIYPKLEILDINEINNQLFKERYIRQSDDEIIIKKISFFRKISKENVIPGFVNAGSKKRKNKTKKRKNKTKSRKNKKTKSMKKKNNK